MPQRHHDLVGHHHQLGKEFVIPMARGNSPPLILALKKNADQSESENHKLDMFGNHQLEIDTNQCLAGIVMDCLIRYEPIYYTISRLHEMNKMSHEKYTYTVPIYWSVATEKCKGITIFKSKKKKETQVA